MRHVSAEHAWNFSKRAAGDKVETLITSNLYLSNCNLGNRTGVRPPPQSNPSCLGRCRGNLYSALSFYGQILLGSTALKGFGECKLAKSNFPEQGMTVFRCFLDLSSLSGKYIGGQLTSNTVVSRKPIGTESDPAGYTQLSIATIRLWRKRDGH
jgi:hypothetical protein